MKIINLPQSQQPQQSGTRTVKDTGAAGSVVEIGGRNQAGASPQTEDRVELSGAAKEIQRVAELAKSAPDVRAEKVAALKEQIQNGTYEVDSKQVATKMLVDSLTDLT
jgi:negative regulator of flagellin synthesis FlgM